MDCVHRDAGVSQAAATGFFAARARLQPCSSLGLARKRTSFAFLTRPRATLWCYAPLRLVSVSPLLFCFSLLPSVRCSCLDSK